MKKATLTKTVPPWSWAKPQPPGRGFISSPARDPGEGYVATNSQLFGEVEASGQPSNAGFVTNYSSTLTWESRDPSWSVLPGTVADEIMVMFTPETLPVLSGLAKGFAVCDQWFSSVPTETLPNRAFAGAATSQGHMDDKAKTVGFTEHFRPALQKRDQLVGLWLRKPSAHPATFQRHH